MKLWLLLYVLLVGVILTEKPSAGSVKRDYRNLTCGNESKIWDEFIKRIRADKHFEWTIPHQDIFQEDFDPYHPECIQLFEDFELLHYYFRVIVISAISAINLLIIIDSNVALTVFIIILSTMAFVVYQ